MPIDSKTARAYSEVYAVLQCLGREYTDKLPEGLLDFFDKHRDKSYDYRIDDDVPDSEQFNDMSREGLALIAYLNLEYWATAEEREQLIKTYKRNDKIYKLKQYESMLEESEDS